MRMWFVLLAQIVPVDRASSEYLDRGVLGLTAFVSLIGLIYLFLDGKKDRRECTTRERDLLKQLQTQQEAAQARETQWQLAWQAREKECATRVENVQAQRVDDAQKGMAKLVQVSDACTVALTKSAAAEEATADALDQNRTVQERLSDKMDRLIELSAHPGRYSR